MWRKASVMAEPFALTLEPARLDALVDLCPAAGGRDVKGLAKLVAKYRHHKKVAPSLDVFRRCAVVRGVDLGAAAG